MKNLKQGLCCIDGMNSANEADKRDPQLTLRSSVYRIKDARHLKKSKTLAKCVYFANEVICLQSYLDKDPLN
jgi:hypothetical protein